MQVSNHKDFLNKLLLKNSNFFDNFEILSVYKNSQTALKIKTKYGVCLSKPNHLLNGKHPSIQTAIDKNEYFINQAKEKHGDFYDYNLVEYINGRTKVKIVCKTHGQFEILPNSHLQKQGCKECGTIKRTLSKLTPYDIFLKKSNLLFNYKYDYSKFIYINAHAKSIIICPEHGEFKKSPAKHLSRKQGCPDCSHVNTMISSEEFLKKSKDKYGEKFNYDLVDYKNFKIKVNIVCPVHGVFEQTPTAHINSKHGCSKCGTIQGVKLKKEIPVGWTFTNWDTAGQNSKNFVAYQCYIIKCWNEKEEFFKVGKTFVDVDKRFSGVNAMPYNYEIVNIVEGDAVEISKLELQLKKVNKEYGYLPKVNFGGYLECFSKIKNYN